MSLRWGGDTCEDITVLGPDEAPLDEGANGHLPARGAAQAGVAGTLAAKLVHGEGVGGVPSHHSHHKVGTAPVFLCGEMNILKRDPLSELGLMPQLSPPV